MMAINRTLGTLISYFLKKDVMAESKIKKLNIEGKCYGVVVSSSNVNLSVAPNYTLSFIGEDGKSIDRITLKEMESLIEKHKRAKLKEKLKEADKELDEANKRDKK
jgi:hypothetical protein